jgi:hypothetical protein
MEELIGKSTTSKYTTSMADSLATLHTDVGNLTSKVNKIYEVIVGEPQFNTMGIVTKVQNLEKDVADINSQFSKIKWFLIGGGLLGGTAIGASLEKIIGVLIK